VGYNLKYWRELLEYYREYGVSKVNQDFQLFFKHLYSYSEWQETPFMPWNFDTGILFSALQFFESTDIQTSDFNLKKRVDCPIFMDSGAFSASAMGFVLDPYEVCEIHRITRADYAVPLDLVITEEDPEQTRKEKISKTIDNTKLLQEYIPTSTILAPIQGFTKTTMEVMFEEYRKLGITKFALGGLVFQRNIEANLKRIVMARKITQGYFLHIFGKFLHPKLLSLVVKTDADSVDGYGYIISSIKGKYIDVSKRSYVGIGKLEEENFQQCSCAACRNYDLLDFQRGDRDAQHLLLEHNINALIVIKDQILEQ